MSYQKSLASSGRLLAGGDRSGWFSRSLQDRRKARNPMDKPRNVKPELRGLQGLALRRTSLTLSLTKSESFSRNWQRTMNGNGL